MEIKFDRLAGPLTSLVLNGLVIFCLYNFVKFAVSNKADEIEVMVMEIEEVNLEEFQEQLEELQELDTVMDNDVVTDVQVDTETPEVTENTESVDDFQNLDVMNDFSSPVVMKGLFANRSASGRAASLRNYAGRYGKATEAAVMKALEWLRLNQDPKGNWGGWHPAAVTSLGLMTFLAHGETPSSEKYGETVEKAIKYLLSKQDKQTGLFTAKSGHYSYEHAVVTYGVSEAYAMTRIPALKPAMEKGVQAIIDGMTRRQLDKSGSMQPVAGLDQPGASKVTGGSWGYSYGPQEAKWDTSVAGWHAQALKAAKLAGAKNPKLDEALALTKNGLKGMQGNAGAIAYSWKKGDEPPARGTPNMTSVGCLALQLLGEGKSPEVGKALNALSEIDVNPKSYKNFYYRNYYTTQAKFHAGKGSWKAWNGQFAPIFTKIQEEDGSWKTPNAPEGEKGHGIESSGSIAYPTSLAALSLMVYYRNLPTFQEKATQEDVAGSVDDDDIELEIL